MKAPIPKEEENLIVDYIYLIYLIDSLESDRSMFSKLGMKIPEAYVSFIDFKIEQISKYLVEVKQQMRSLKIRVEEPQLVNVEFMEYHYFAHGYEGKMRFWNAAMEFEGTKRLAKFFQSPS